MRSKAVATRTADEINRQHRLAKETASQAVDHALACGELLLQVKGELPHGDFLPWVQKHCEFAERTAQAYMQAARNPQRVAGFNTLRQALGYEPKPKSSRPLDESPDTPKGAVSVLKEPAATGSTEETAEERPAAPVTPAAVKAATEPTADPAGVPAGGGVLVDDEPTYEPDEAEEDAALAAAEAELAASIDKVMGSDDRLAAAYAEIKRQAAEIAALKISRDGFMGGKAEVMNLLQREQRKTAALQRKLDAANAEIERLKERVAIQEGA